YEYISESSIRLFWKNRMESAFLYLVYRKQGAEDFVLQKSVADTFFVDDSVRVGETFQYKIVPKNVYETGDSSTVTVTIQRVFNPPAIVSIKQLPGSRSVEIQWTDNSNAEVNYWVYRDGLIISKLDPNSTVFVDNDTTNSLQVGETYRYYVEITDRGGKVQASGEQQITITDPGLPPFSFLIDSALISQNRIADI
ncbi:hypothetical protein JW935_08615, partial [candidate division KSB1 bacterium]|nr:hypothetical protein [candidate division KSB1 bacterium]